MHQARHDEAPAGVVAGASRASGVATCRGPTGRSWEVTWTLPEPMLTTPVSVPDLRPGCAAEPKWDTVPSSPCTRAGGCCCAHGAARI